MRKNNISLHTMIKELAILQLANLVLNKTVYLIRSTVF